MKKITWNLRIKTVSEANCTQHWTKKSKRHKLQQFFIRQVFEKNTEIIEFPCVVRLTRIAPRALDDDNLCMAFKWIRDEISECLFPENDKTYIDSKGRLRKVKGREDSNPLVKWRYAQSKVGKIGIQIDIFQEEERK